jgi:hypothetical protein
MTGSPFSNVLGHDPDDSTFQNVKSGQPGDTTSETAARPPDSPSEPSPGVEADAQGDTHVSGQDETAGDASSGTLSDVT